MMIVNLPKHIDSSKRKSAVNGYLGKSITEINSNGFFTVDRNWTVMYWNKSAERLLGVESKDIVGTNLWEKFASAIPLDFYAVYHKAFLQDTPVHFREYWAEKGTWFDVITFHNDDLLSVSFKSSSSAHHPECSPAPDHPSHQLFVMNQLYRLVTEVTNDCLWEWDFVTKEIFWIDGGHKRVFGYDVENALISQSFWENCLHPQDKDRVLANLETIISSHTTNLWQDEYRFKKSDGVYAYVRDRGHIVYNDQRQAIKMIGATQDVTEVALLRKKMTGEQKKQQAAITDAVFTALEDEKTTIGKELYLIQAQELTLARIYLSMGKNQEKNRELYLEKSYGFLLSAIQELNKVWKDLGIPERKGSYLFKGVQALLDDLMLIHPIIFKLSIQALEEDDLSERTKLTVFRIIQEQLKNILSHSHAKEAVITMNKVGDQMNLLISDNGLGCDLGKVFRGVGILNIKSRMTSYNGTVNIRSAPGKGYELNIRFPMTGPTLNDTMDRPASPAT